MTHNDIYTKFLIEYDKANVTSSYPALTPYEIATILDRAYLALIARKLTGNNPRRSTFESDTKSIEDLRPLVVTSSVNLNSATGTAENEYVYSLPQKLLYFLESDVDYSGISGAADGKSHKREVVDLVSHSLAKNFTATTVNMPWIKRPVAFIEDDKIHILVDSYKHPNGPSAAYVTYIKQFNKFAGSSSTSSESSSDSSNAPSFLFDDTDYQAPSISTTTVELTNGDASYRFTCTTTVPNCKAYWVKSNSSSTLSNGVLSNIVEQSNGQSLSTTNQNVLNARFVKTTNPYYVQYAVSDSDGNYIAHSPVLTIPEATSSPSSGSGSGSSSGSGSGSGSSSGVSDNTAVFNFRTLEGWRSMLDLSFSDLLSIDRQDGSAYITNRTLRVGPVSIKISPSGDAGSNGYIINDGSGYGLKLGIYCKLEISVSGGYSLLEIQIPDDVQGTFIDILGWDTAHLIWTALSGGILKAVYQNGWMDNNLHKIIVKYGI